MPIRPENRDRYPANWPEISAAIKARSGGQCECLGECGRRKVRAGGGIGEADVSGWPVPTRAEVRQARADREAGRHWTGCKCWCRGTGRAGEHGAGELVPPPWATYETTGESQ